MSRGAALAGALLATLATPATWPLALAAFLVRGGLLVVVLPIVVLPSPVGLGNLLAPTLMTVVFRGMSVGVVVIVGLVVLAIVAWIVVGGQVAAILEAEAARIMARDDEGPGAPRRESGPSSAPRARRVASRILLARVLAHVPTGFALIWGSARLGAVAYRELTSPFDVTSPIALRVLGGAPEVIAVIVVVWMLGEILGGIAARRIAIGGAGVPGALRDAFMTVVRHPLAVFIGFWVPTAALILVVVPSALAATAAWRIVRVAMRPPTDPFWATLAVLLLVALWIVGLVLIAVTAAWRAAVWSVGHRELSERRAGSTERESG
ncbi:MAG: hypothetical protein Q7S35_00135 [Candidatus Limnocylindrales bacterium]|nr:hypothetical protein [Candidatus Limnocylindrales bacterium]